MKAALATSMTVVRVGVAGAGAKKVLVETVEE